MIFHDSLIASVSFTFIFKDNDDIVYDSSICVRARRSGIYRLYKLVQLNLIFKVKKIR